MVALWVAEAVGYMVWTGGALALEKHVPWYYQVPIGVGQFFLSTNPTTGPYVKAAAQYTGRMSIAASRSVVSATGRAVFTGARTPAAVGAARFAGAAAAAVIVPVAVGYGVSYLIEENTGYEDATSDYVDFLTGGVSPSEWWSAVTLESMR